MRGDKWMERKLSFVTKDALTVKATDLLWAIGDDFRPRRGISTVVEACYTRSRTNAELRSPTWEPLLLLRCPGTQAVLERTSHVLPHLSILKSVGRMVPSHGYPKMNSDAVRLL